MICYLLAQYPAPSGQPHQPHLTAVHTAGLDCAGIPPFHTPLAQPIGHHHSFSFRNRSANIGPGNRQGAFPLTLPTTQQLNEIPKIPQRKFPITMEFSGNDVWPMAAAWLMGDEKSEG